MVDHIAAQHGNMFKISFLVFLIEMFLFQISFLPKSFAAYTSCCYSFFFIQLCTSFTGDYSQLKSKYYKHESCPALSFSRKGEQDGHWQSFSAGLSHEMSTSKTASDPFLSFLYGASADNESKYIHPDSSSEVSIEEIHSNDKVLERYETFCFLHFV